MTELEQKRADPVLTDRQFRQILADADIEYRGPGEVPKARPKTLALRAFPLPVQVYITSMAESCRMYLSWPTLVDKFQTHDERRDWRNRMTKEWGLGFNSKYEQNKLKSPAGNMVAYFDGLIQLLDDAKAKGPLAEGIRAIRKELPYTAGYNDEMSLENKLQFIKKVDAAMYRFLNLVSQSS